MPTTFKNYNLSNLKNSFQRYRKKSIKTCEYYKIYTESLEYWFYFNYELSVNLLKVVLFSVNLLKSKLRSLKTKVGIVQ